MNPYHELFDQPERLNAIEHTTECLIGIGIPWGSEPPRPGDNGSSIRHERIRRAPRARRPEAGTVPPSQKEST